MKVLTTGMAALFLASGLTGIAAPKAKSKAAAKKPALEVKYKAVCGMIYSAANAKKNHYVCPMDKKPLKKITVPAQKGKASSKPMKLGM